MSYLELTAGIAEFDRAIISLWFRIPAESMIAAADEPESPDRVMKHLIPLLTFGRKQQETELIPQTENLCDPVDAFGPFLITTTDFEEGAEFDLAPCYIAVDCSDTDTDQGNEMAGVLVINIQMSDTATGTGIAAFDLSAESRVPSNEEQVNAWQELCDTPGSGWTFQRNDQIDDDGIITPHSYFVEAAGIEDLSEDVLEAKPDLFYVETLPPIKPDQWHHLLLSFDLGKDGIKTTGPGRNPDPTESINRWRNVSEGAINFAKMWFALDDVDYRGRRRIKYEEGTPDLEHEPKYEYHFGPYSVDCSIQQPDGTYPETPAGDPNGILTKAGFDPARFGTSTVTLGNTFLPVPEYTFDSHNIPSGQNGDTAAPMGIPASADYVEHIYQIELAEFQMWTGQTLDTGDENNRRLFISDSGKPVSPTVANKGRVDQSIEGLGKPTVMLHGSKKWIKGQNAGTAGIDDDGKVIDDGQFVPTARIIGWRPNPSLHGPQNPKQKASAA